MESETKPAIKATVENLAEHLASYGETYLKLGVLNATQKATDIASATTIVGFLLILCIFIMLFTSFGIAIWLNGVWENDVAGYLAVAGFYTLVAIIFLTLRKKVILPFFRDFLIRKTHE